MVLSRFISSIVFWNFAISWLNRWSVCSCVILFSPCKFFVLGRFGCLLAIQCLSVIEEKGEGFENGKDSLACLV